jgi:hypothetical protein
MAAPFPLQNFHLKSKKKFSMLEEHKHVSPKNSLAGLRRLFLFKTRPV